MADALPVCSIPRLVCAKWELKAMLFMDWPGALHQLNATCCSFRCTSCLQVER